MMEVNDLPYDYNSLMHYPLNAFAIDESVPTIITRRETNVTIGQRRGPSPNDYLEINRLYNCQRTIGFIIHSRQYFVNNTHSGKYWEK